MLFLILGLASAAAMVGGYAGGRHMLRAIEDGGCDGVYVGKVRLTKEEQKEVDRSHRRDSICAAACVTCWIIMVVAFFMTTIFLSRAMHVAVVVPKEVALFTQNKEYIEGHKSDDPIEDAAITQTKIEMNQWLFGAQYSRERWGWWSVYPDEVLEIKPIE